MKPFSHRKGIKPFRSILQVDSMDDSLRNKLWDALTVFYWDRMGQIRIHNIPYYRKQKASYYKKFKISKYSNMHILLKRLWVKYFEKPLDTLDDY